jgi:succinate---hydroxymethylglutarate CoA-transferase
MKSRHLSKQVICQVRLREFLSRSRNRQLRKSSTAVENAGALAGVKIVDLSRVLAAPLCTQILGDYGADIIKIEDVARGDDTRYWKVKGEDAAWNEGIGPMSNYFAAVNRNKRSMRLDLKQEKGRNVFLQLVKTADVLVENMRPGAMQRLGIDYDVLSEVNPRLIYASVSGYGPSGPYKNRAGYDMIAGAEAGLLHLTGERDGPPVRPGLGLTDMSTGLLTHGAIMGALYARERTGRGQRIDASLFETQVALLTNVAMAWLNMGQEAERWGTQHPSVVPYDAFKTKDLYFVCGATNDKQFGILCEKLGLDSLPSDERFKTNAARVANREVLFPILNEAFAAKSTAEWDKAFEGSGMPYGAINTMEKVFSHPQTHARAMVQKIDFEAATSGKLSILGPAVKFSDTKATVRSKPPLHGQHTSEILQELGLSEQEIQGLATSEVI